MEDKDPKDLTDAELDAALEGKDPKEPDKTPDEPEEPAAPEPSKEEDPELTPDEPAEGEPAAEPPVSKREGKRIQELINRMKGDGPKPTVPDALNYGEALDADPDLIAKLEADRKSVQENAFAQGMEQAKSLQFHTRLEIDTPRVFGEYPRLNPKAPEFDAADADEVNTLYLELVGYDVKTDTVKNPNLRYADFVESFMNLSERLATRKVAESSENIAKQAATTSLRPDGSQAKKLNLNKDPEDMTDEELDAAIARGIPAISKRR